MYGVRTNIQSACKRVT